MTATKSRGELAPECHALSYSAIDAWPETRGAEALDFRQGSCKRCFWGRDKNDVADYVISRQGSGRGSCSPLSRNDNLQA
jgi:hypothetical protein